MDGVGKFLDRYKHLTPPEGSKRKVLCDVIRHECGIVVDEKSITIRGNGAYLSCHPTLRGEIRLCAPRVLTQLHQQHNIHLAFIR